jgi:hypothetical protein
VTALRKALCEGASLVPQMNSVSNPAFLLQCDCGYLLFFNPQPNGEIGKPHHGQQQSDREGEQ